MEWNIVFDRFLVFGTFDCFIVDSTALDNVMMQQRCSKSGYCSFFRDLIGCLFIGIALLKYSSNILFGYVMSF